MNPTRLPSLVGLAVVTALLGWFAINLRTGDLLSLPFLAPATAGLIAVFELVLAKVVRDRLRGTGGARLQPMQIARAAVLAKASSATGAILTGLYAGLWLWFFQHDELRIAAHDAVVAGVSVGASVVLVVAALLLERVCRTPSSKD